MNGDDIERFEPGTAEAVAEGIVDFFGDYRFPRASVKVIAARIREFAQVETMGAILRERQRNFNPASNRIPDVPTRSPLPIQPGGRLCSIDGLAPEAHHPPPAAEETGKETRHEWDWSVDINPWCGACDEPYPCRTLKESGR